MMKLLLIFATVVAVAYGAHSKWTLDDLADAIQNPTTNPSLLPILEKAINEFMLSIYSGKDLEYVTIKTEPIDLNTWSLQELSEALHNPNTNPMILPYLENALNQLMLGVFTGDMPDASAGVAVSIPAMDISYWSLNEVDSALQDPKTHPALLPQLENALNKMAQNIFDGIETKSIVLAFPEEYMPKEEMVVVHEPVIALEPISEPDTPVGPASPLVQIILNVNLQDAQPDPEIPVPEPLPAPVLLPQPIVLPPPKEPVVMPEPEPPVEKPQPIILPPPSLPIVIPEPIKDPEVVTPKPIVLPPVPGPVVIPEPAKDPEQVIIPSPIVKPPFPAPIVIPEPIVLPPAPAPIINP